MRILDKNQALIYNGLSVGIAQATALPAGGFVPAE
jgi:hypothetical protein